MQVGVVLHGLGNHDKERMVHTRCVCFLLFCEHFHSVIGWVKDMKSVDNPGFRLLSLFHATLKFCIIAIKNASPFNLCSSLEAYHIYRLIFPQIMLLVQKTNS